MNRRLARTALPAAATLALTVIGAGAAEAAGPSTAGSRVVGHVYEATNDAAGNAVQVFDRTADGRVLAGPLVPTGGLGAGASLHSQYGVVRSGNLLFVVNGGDSTVSTLAITKHGLVWRDTESSHGTLPVSIAVHDAVAYVLNQGSDTVAGFFVGSDGHLRPIPGSTRALTPAPGGANTAAAEVAFTPNGRTVVVTEKATNVIDTFAVHGAYLSGAVAHASAGTTPYGFAFDGHAHLLVSEATTGSVSSYRVTPSSFSTVAAALPDTQTAACWLVVTGNGRFAYTVNAGTATISSYRVAADGSLALLDAVAGSTAAGSTPTDAILSPDSRSLYVRTATGVSAFAVAPDGSLSATGTATADVVAGTAGIAAD